MNLSSILYTLWQALNLVGLSCCSVQRSYHLFDLCSTGDVAVSVVFSGGGGGGGGGGGIRVCHYCPPFGTKTLSKNLFYKISRLQFKQGKLKRIAIFVLLSSHGAPLWHFLWGGLSACWIRALAASVGGVVAVVVVALGACGGGGGGGGLCVLCGCLVGGICVGFARCGGIH